MKLTEGQILLSREDVMAIPDNMLPMMVLSDNLRSLFSWGIKVHEQGSYNHFMWLIRPGIMASQNFPLFKLCPVKSFFSGYRMKFWYNKNWTAFDREKIRTAIATDLAKPWYKKIYDCVAIVGQAIHCDWLQTPGIDICSDKANYVREVDLYYDLSHPDPEEVNRWLMMNEKHGYEVYGRYVPD